ncbi:PaaI family thioesterase [Solimonas sp. K1W22B-7]|uniref:PaaI family thioesterase n=1 Tax=Solimonas sp. K1W22B-7 TaxID=2303331 RepID=UPI000E33301A|nr:PaaI family thioesterase [Solimonas sp. K1W22B-7]AXQ30664.1 PaaI family thioesterase [Solimonas sp. K1W22B-7]
MQNVEAMDAETLLAAGWKRLDAGGFTGTLSPLWLYGTDPERTLGFIVDERHSNNHQGSLHGGALMTFADIALGYRAARATGHSSLVTAQLQIQFVASAKVGNFVSCRPELIRSSSQLAFVRGLICVGNKTVGSADGIWKVLEQKPKP